jgi:hypothetical protein
MNAGTVGRLTNYGHICATICANGRRSTIAARTPTRMGLMSVQRNNDEEREARVTAVVERLRAVPHRKRLQATQTARRSVRRKTETTIKRRRS